MKKPGRSTQAHTFEPIAESHNSDDHLDLEDLHEVKLTIHADLGNCKMYVRDILELREGSVVQLNKMAGEMTDIYLNGLPLAKGEVVVIGDSLHVRIAEILGTAEKTPDDES